MMVRAIAAALALIGSSDAVAGEVPRYAQTASLVADAIRAGTDVASLDEMPKISAAENARLRELAGCEWRLQPGATPYLVDLAWQCSSAKEGISTLMRFNPEGEMFVFAINPLEEEFAPTPTALADAHLPGATKIAALFGKAVKDGADPSLGGLIPLIALQRDQLAELRNISFRASAPLSRAEKARLRKFLGEGALPHPSRDRVHTLVWENDDLSKIGQPSAELWFDEEGRPIGVKIERVIIRKASFTTGG